MTRYAQLLRLCGLSTRGAAELLKSSYDTSKSRMQGKRNAPPEALEKLERYAKAASDIFGR